MYNIEDPNIFKIFEVIKHLVGDLKFFHFFFILCCLPNKLYIILLLLTVQPSRSIPERHKLHHHGSVQE